MSNRVTPEGKMLGAAVSRMFELGQHELESVGLGAVGFSTIRSEMCASCACRAGTVPNGCFQTQMDLLKAVNEKVPFLCHAPADGRMCAGFIRVAAHVAKNPLPVFISKMLSDWTFSPPDEPVEGVKP